MDNAAKKKLELKNKDLFYSCKAMLERAQEILGEIDYDKFEQEINMIDDVHDEVCEQIFVIDMAHDYLDQFRNEQTCK